MLKDMPKTEGAKGKIQEHTGGTKTEPPEGQPPTYFELGIDKKDASRCQQMAENKKEINIQKMPFPAMGMSKAKLQSLPKPVSHIVRGMRQ